MQKEVEPFGRKLLNLFQEVKKTKNMKLKIQEIITKVYLNRKVYFNLNRIAEILHFCVIVAAFLLNKIKLIF